MKHFFICYVHPARDPVCLGLGRGFFVYKQCNPFTPELQWTEICCFYVTFCGFNSSLIAKVVHLFPGWQEFLQHLTTQLYLESRAHCNSALVSKFLFLTYHIAFIGFKTQLESTTKPFFAFIILGLKTCILPPNLFAFIILGFKTFRNKHGCYVP